MRINITYLFALIAIFFVVQIIRTTIFLPSKEIIIEKEPETPVPSPPPVNEALHLGLLTAIIKGTGLKCAERCYQSLAKHLPELKIVIGVEQPAKIPQNDNSVIQWVSLPEDCGLARGRNILLKYVSTPYVLLLDDDFVFHDNPREGLLWALNQMAQSGIDILGGCVFGSTCSGYQLVPPSLSNPVLQVSILKKCQIGERVVHMADMVDNFFIANTSSLYQVMWDDALKVGEHEDFFLRAYNVLKVGVTGAYLAYNDRKCREEEGNLADYNQRRSRIFQFWKIAFQKWRYTEFRSPYFTYQLKCKNTQPFFSENLDDCSVETVASDPAQNPNIWGNAITEKDPFPKFYRQLPVQDTTSSSTIGVVVVATGKYKKFLKLFFETVEKYFVPTSKKIYYVFTDAEITGFPQYTIHTFFQKSLGWPYDSLLRFEMIYKKIDQMNVPYVYIIDVDIEVTNTIDHRILSELVCTINPWYWAKQVASFPYDRFPLSPAYLKRADGRYYFAGGFFGGTMKAVKEMLREVSSISSRMLTGDIPYVSPWHDESIVNYYFHKIRKPSLIAGPEFLYPEPPADNWMGPIVKQYYSTETTRPLMLNLGVRKAFEDKDIRSYFVEINESKPSVVEKSYPIKPFSCSSFHSYENGSALCGHTIFGAFNLEQVKSECSRLDMQICTIRQLQQLAQVGYCNCFDMHVLNESSEYGYAGTTSSCTYCSSLATQYTITKNENFAGGVVCCKYLSTNTLKNLRY